jgi:hypothetical protein
MPVMKQTRPHTDGAPLLGHAPVLETGAGAPFFGGCVQSCSGTRFPSL